LNGQVGDAKCHQNKGVMQPRRHNPNRRLNLNPLLRVITIKSGIKITTKPNLCVS
jgi:hypothetical protein